jgi:predicted transcriptional regulator
LPDRQKEILEILERGPLNRKQIMSKMKNPPSDRTVQTDLLLLNKLGLITAEGKARALTWVSTQK